MLAIGTVAPWLFLVNPNSKSCKNYWYKHAKNFSFLRLPVTFPLQGVGLSVSYTKVVFFSESKACYLCSALVSLDD